MMGKHHVVVNCAMSLALVTGCAAMEPVLDKSLLSGLFVSVTSVSPFWGKTCVLLLCVAGLLVGSLFPDIDNKKSFLGRYFRFPGEHRGWTHTVWVCLVLFPMIFVFSVSFWFWLGYLLHLCVDSVSAGGICWFYPITKYRVYKSGAKVAKNHHIKLYRTGQLSEWWFMAFLILCSLALVVYFGFFQNGWHVLYLFLQPN